MLRGNWNINGLKVRVCHYSGSESLKVTETFCPRVTRQKVHTSLISCMPGQLLEKTSSFVLEMVAVEWNNKLGKN
jgi:hypothetical protein